MTAFRFARVALLSLASLVLPSATGAAGLEDDYVFPREAEGDDAGPATRRQDERRRANDADWFRAPVEQGPIDFPSAEVHDAVVANARAATARAMYRRAESAMHASVRAAVREFEQSAELREAQSAEQRAYDALQDARRDALRFVVEDPKYQAMQDLRESLSQQIAERREGTRQAPADVAPGTTRLVSTKPAAPLPRPRGDDVVAMATVKLRVGSDASAMEREAMADNEKVRQAKADLAVASAKVGALREGFDRSLRNNEQFKAARDELEEARIARVTAAAYLQGADLAAGEALDFAYYLHRYDYYRYNHHYDYGYGSYRYGYPYYGVSYIGRR